MIIPEIEYSLIYYSIIYKINPLKLGRAFFSTYGVDFATTRWQNGILTFQFNKRKYSSYDEYILFIKRKYSSYNVVAYVSDVHLPSIFSI